MLLYTECPFQSNAIQCQSHVNNAQVKNWINHYFVLAKFNCTLTQYLKSTITLTDWSIKSQCIFLGRKSGTNANYWVNGNH